MTAPLWTPSADRVAQSNLTRFARGLEAKGFGPFPNYDTLWQWSIDDRATFWSELWDLADIIGDKGPVAIERDGEMPGARFFPQGSLNFAENLLRWGGPQDALVFRAEDQVQSRMSWDELHALVSRLQQFLTAIGVKPGDRVAGYVPNAPETVAAMLAATSLGAIWTSCSPDFGVQGVLDRFGQTAPKVVFAAERYVYNGKIHDCMAKLSDVVARLPSVESVVVFGMGRPPQGIIYVPRGITLDDAIAPFAARPVEFTRMEFNHPLYIMYSSGTTGVPKCIVHGAGGTLLQQVKEHILQSDVKPGDRVFYFTTCGWMMWNWLVAGLSAGATLLLYDGSPFAPSGNVLFDYADAEGMTLFGTSAKYIDALAKSGLEPMHTHSLATVRTMCSTGSPLAPESFDYVYRSIKTDIQLASISGGTDIVSCFMLGSPWDPVWRGEIQRRGLGLAVDVFDENGKPVRGEKGELVCTRAFPCMPVGFWNDPDDARYRAAYFERYPNIWYHGDFVELTGHGGIIVFGRSDATLNPGGVRIGTAEIYRVVETFPEVLEALVIGQDWKQDVRVVLFLRMADGRNLTDELAERIRKAIRAACTPRHVPAKIVAVADIPRTKSGKITELAVRDVVHGRAVKNKEALANPEALNLYAAIPALKTD